MALYSHFMLAMSSWKRNFLVWCPFVRLSVLSFFYVNRVQVHLFSNLHKACGAYTTWLTRGQHTAWGKHTFPSTYKEDERSVMLVFIVLIHSNIHSLTFFLWRYFDVFNFLHLLRSASSSVFSCWVQQHFCLRFLWSASGSYTLQVVINTLMMDDNSILKT